MKRKHIKRTVASIPHEGAAAVAGMIADPMDFPPVRKGGTYNTVATAVGRPYNREDITWDPTVAIVAPATMSLPSTDFGGFIFRNPMRSAVIYKRYPASTWAYQWIFNPVNNEAFEPVTTTAQAYISTGETKELWPIWASASPSNTYNPHGSTLYAAEDDGFRYIWIDGDAGSGAASAITINVAFSTVTTSAASRKLYIYRYDSGQRRLITTADSGAIGTNSIVVTLNQATGLMTSGYYALSIENLEPTATLASVLTSSANTLGSWAHYSLNQWDTFKANMQELRVLGASILYQNKASPLNKQGKVVVTQISGAVDWYTGVVTGTGMYSYLTGTPGSGNFNLEDGLYAWLKPSKESDMEYLPNMHTIGDGGRIEDAQYPLQGADYLGFCCSCSQLGAGDGVWTICHAIEYRTRSMYINTLPPTISPGEWDMGVMAAISMEQYYHNPIHWKKIFATIGKIARVGAPVLKLFGPYGQMAGELADVIGSHL